MEVIIKSRNIEITEHLKDYAEKKFRSACRFIPHILENEAKDKEQVGRDVDRIILEVEIEKVTGEEKGRIFRAEAQMITPGKVFKAEDVAETVKVAIDEAKYELERQINDHKDKIDTMKKKEGQQMKRKRG